MYNIEKIESELKKLNFDFDITEYIDLNDVCEQIDRSDEAFDTIRDILNDEAFDDNSYVIYYGSAMEYLSKYDASLNISLGLAAELGYSLENLNSEKLASLLKADNLRDDFNDLETEINEIFENNEIEEND